MQLCDGEREREEHTDRSLVAESAQREVQERGTCDAGHQRGQGQASQATSYGIDAHEEAVKPGWAEPTIASSLSRPWMAPVATQASSNQSPSFGRPSWRVR